MGWPPPCDNLRLSPDNLSSPPHSSACVNTMHNAAHGVHPVGPKLFVMCGAHPQNVSCHRRSLNVSNNNGRFRVFCLCLSTYLGKSRSGEKLGNMLIIPPAPQREKERENSFFGANPLVSQLRCAVRYGRELTNVRRYFARPLPRTTASPELCVLLTARSNQIKL